MSMNSVIWWTVTIWMIASTSLGKIITVTDNIYNTSNGNSGSGSGSIGCACDSQHFCECYTHTLEEALNNLVGDNDIINVTIPSIALSSHTVVKQLHNITIIGHNYPEIDCNCYSLKFVDCNSIIIKGIKWNKCGYSFLSICLNHPQGEYNHYAQEENELPFTSCVVSIRNSIFLRCHNISIQDSIFLRCHNISIQDSIFLRCHLEVFQSSGIIEFQNVHFLGDCKLHCEQRNSMCDVTATPPTCTYSEPPCSTECLHGLHIHSTYHHDVVKIKIFNCTFTQLLVINIKNTHLDLLVDFTKFYNNTVSAFPGQHGKGIVNIVPSTYATHLSSIAFQNVIFDSNNAARSLVYISGFAIVKFRFCHFINNIVTSAVLSLDTYHVRITSSILKHNNGICEQSYLVYALTTFIVFSKVQVSSNTYTAAKVLYLDSNHANITDSRFNHNKGYSALVYVAAMFIDICKVQISSNVGGVPLSLTIREQMHNVYNQSFYLFTALTGNISVHSLQLFNNTVLFGDGLVVVPMVVVSNLNTFKAIQISFNTIQINYNTLNNGSILSFIGLDQSKKIMSTYKRSTYVEKKYSEQKIDIVNATVENNSGNMHGAVIYVRNPPTFTRRHNRYWCNVKRYWTIERSAFNHLTNIKSVVYVSGPTDNTNEYFQGIVQSFYIPYIIFAIQDEILIKSCAFSNNDGTALQIANASLILGENVIFDSNIAEYGGAVILDSNSKLTIRANSEVIFSNNKALRYGGAIYCNVSLENACFKNINNVLLVVNDSNTVIKFNKNTAGLGGDSVYLSVPESCIEIFNKSNITSHYFGEYMVTSPTELQLDSPAHLLADSNDLVNPVYIINNIMLGQAIIFPSCALDFNHKPAGSVAFLLRTVDSSPGYLLSSSALYSVACGPNSGDNNLRVTGMKVFTNHTPQITIQLSLYDTVYNWKPFFVQLIIEISPCHSGFYHDTLQEKCVCYTRDNIVSCSGSNATIRRGYWFGVVNDHPTVTVCPLNFCNYADCDISTRTCPLKALPDDQCEGSRSGAACGSCLHGYTLPFDYHECVHVNNCTVGYTAMVVAITCLYWILIIIAVFGLMYFKVGIGYLYSVTFYYSVLDILFGQILQNSKVLHDFVAVLSSLARLTPQFLGQFCLVKGLSGIDQQFIHYAHPLAVVLLLLLLSMFTRFSPRLSLFVSRAVIHVICFLLLLSYTSISSTSLLLIRPLTFTGVDKVYTYLSPNLEYFHGRHLMYGLVAILCGIVIAMGLPLVLTLEPFINHKINFTRFKPLLDQFQGCYKDRYRCFASYHMICRLIMIVTVNINTNSNTFITLYLLLGTCAVICIINATVQPYSCYVVNVVDSSILLIMMLDILLQMIGVSSGFATDTIVAITFVLTVLPALIVSFVGMLLNKQHFTKGIFYCLRFCKLKEAIETANQDTEMSSYVDNSLRQKCTDARAVDDSAYFRDSLLELSTN